MIWFWRWQIDHTLLYQRLSQPIGIFKSIFKQAGRELGLIPGSTRSVDDPDHFPNAQSSTTIWCPTSVSKSQKGGRQEACRILLLAFILEVWVDVYCPFRIHLQDEWWHTEYFTAWWVLAISTNKPLITQNTWKSCACLSHLRMLISHVVITGIMLLSNSNLVELSGWPSVVVNLNLRSRTGFWWMKRSIWSAIENHAKNVSINLEF